MVGIIVIGHGRVAVEMVQTLESVLGPIEGLEAIATSYEILTDMLGDTPTNQSLAVARECGAEVVAGVNMPILIKLTTARDQMDARTLARFIQRYGQEHIVWATGR